MRPLTLTPPDVQAALTGAVQVRRRIKAFQKQSSTTHSRDEWMADLLSRCPFGAPGDKAWVRETWGRGMYEHEEHYHDLHGESRSSTVWPSVPLDDADMPPVWYWADGKPSIDCYRANKLSPVTMPRWASRLTLELVAVRVERTAGGWVWVGDWRRV